ncbi:hypothetical protein ACFUKV_10600 [Streptomyces paradoxus]|uniref:hypothetical protein n=1 Tax=Streptomyces paradoxus TaxID=66375 RepID=UPI00362A57C3
MARERGSLETGVTPGQARHERVVAAVETRAAERVHMIAAYMGRPPARADRVDAAAVRALGEESKDLLSGVRTEQKRQVSLAERASSRGLSLGVAAALAAMAEILAAAAAAHGRPAWLLWPATAAACAILPTVMALI